MPVSQFQDVKLLRWVEIPRAVIELALTPLSAIQTIEIAKSVSSLDANYWGDLSTIHRYILYYKGTLQSHHNNIFCLMKNSIGAMNNVHSFDFCFLITYGVCKKRKYCNRMSEKKKFSPFDECSCFVNLKRQKEQKKKFRPSVCLSVCLSGCTYVRGLFMWTQ